MSRSSWKPHFNTKEWFSFKNFDKKTIQTSNRRITIIKDLVGRSIEIYNGIRFFKIEVSEDMIGHKLGEFSPTRKKPKFKEKK
jgi:ribosomal protein S19